MRGKTLEDILNNYRSTARLSLNPAHNRQVRDTQIAHLQRTQEWYWQDHDWPHLRVERLIKLQAGQRYYDLPDDLDIERIQMVEVRYNGRWVPLIDGIDRDSFATYDSELGVRAWPARRIMLREDEQYEIWPIPDTNGDEDTLEGRVKFTGIRKLSPFVQESDRADIDDRLIYLSAAAETLTAEGAKDAGSKSSQVSRLYLKLKGGLVRKGKFKIGMAGSSRAPVLRGPPTVYYRTT